ncbi:MAG: metallophosphoesterase [Pseudomonadota bacterium]
MRCGLIGLLALVLLDCSGGEAVGPTGDVGPEGPPTEDMEPPPPDGRPVIFAVVTDIHIEGGIDDSIAQNVVGLLATAAARDPAPEFIAVTGDLIDAFEEPVDTGPGSKIDALRQIIDGAPVPLEIALGNHDCYVTGEALMAITPDPEARTQLFKDELGIDPWHFTEHGGMRFVYLNGMIGPKAAPSLGLNGSLGQDQLAWLDALLDDGVPSVLFVHQPPSSILDEGGTDLATVVRDHAESVLAIFVGHIHVWGRDSFEGVPVYLTSAGYGGEDFHHVRVDPAAGTVEILNADGIDYGETEIVPCDPARDPVLMDPAALEGVPLVLQVPDAHIQPMGLGTYLREVISEIPLVVRLGATAGSEVAALITVGKRVGDAGEGAPAYIKPLVDGPCAATVLALDGPCFSTAPVDLEIEIGGLLGFPLPPGWRLRAALRELTLTGVLHDDGGVDQGVLETILDFEPGARDVEAILVTEYCKGSLAGCLPGEGDMPACPDAPGPEFFSEIPPACDVNILGFGLRFLFDIFESVPDLEVSLSANFTVWPAAVLEEPGPGGVSPALFTPAPEGTCPAD